MPRPQAYSLARRTLPETVKVLRSRGWASLSEKPAAIHFPCQGSSCLAVSNQEAALALSPWSPHTVTVQV